MACKWNPRRIDNLKTLQTIFPAARREPCRRRNAVFMTIQRFVTIPSPGVPREPTDLSLFPPCRMPVWGLSPAPSDLLARSDPNWVVWRVSGNGARPTRRYEPSMDNRMYLYRLFISKYTIILFIIFMQCWKLTALFYSCNLTMTTLKLTHERRSGVIKLPRWNKVFTYSTNQNKIHYINEIYIYCRLKMHEINIKIIVVISQIIKKKQQ